MLSVGDEDTHDGSSARAETFLFSNGVTEGGIELSEEILLALHTLEERANRDVNNQGPSASESTSTTSIRERFPRTLHSWRVPPSARGQHIAQVAEDVWRPLVSYFKEHGYIFWRREVGCLLSPDVDDEFLAESSLGFGYVTRYRGAGPVVGAMPNLFDFENLNPLCRAARTKSGLDVVIRVLQIGDSGREHVDILRKFATGPNALFNDNHNIPVVEFLKYEDIVFGVFPKVGFRMSEAYGGWAKNSVGDVLDMMQCLEALEFLHDHRIAHRDAFKGNFLVQWHPESLLADHIPRSRLRVYLIDFAVAILFPLPTAPQECRVSGYPMGESFSEDVEQYCRPVPPEVTSGEPYDPFKLDVWQLGTSLEDFKSTIPEIDRILDGMRLPDATARLSSLYAITYLSRAAAELTPKALMIEPELDKSRFEDGADGLHGPQSGP
ncbi:hypothetical protein ONZ51_g459 [Trametes cubensis]|uniref:Protein kinase domain-containing protein n=1 Tax=Trametes cubensis TaxID=1111947 RepID=A0AAD7XIL1_9APHY|nr:hypothetical protein ONZ51_g459 [Trametes cubensis]